MSRFNTRQSNVTVNLAGGKAYSMKPEQELLHAVLTSFLEDKYYESGDQRLDRIVDLVGKCDHEYVAKLAYVTRTEFNMRSVSHVMVGELSKIHKGDSLVWHTIVKTAVRVDDLTELVAYLDGQLSKQVKKGIRRALFKFNRYQLAKYRGENKEFKLVDVFNLVHPKPEYANEEQRQAWKDLIEGKLVSTDTWESEISTTENKKESWEKLIKENKLGYMALIRNLNNLIRENVSDEVRHLAIKKLTDREEVKRSRQLPFRFMTAYNNVVGDRLFTDAISEAMDYAVDNTPELPGKTLIAIDTSGSMGGESIQKASIFGATLAKANRDADVVLYDTSIKELQLSSRTPVIDLAKTIMQEAMGGGTEGSLVFRYAISQRTKYDRVIIISDNESWRESYWGGASVSETYKEYKRQLNADPYVYAIDIQGYGTKDITGADNRVFHLTGWSDKLLDFIGHIEKGNDMIDYINSIELWSDNE